MVATGTKHKIFIALMLFILGASLRLWDVTSQPVQSDEPHWIMRSSKFLYRLENDPTQATSHLVHPGAPAVIIMGAGIATARYWNEINGKTFGDPWYLDDYSGARIANALFSSLLPPILFLILLPILGFASSLFGSALVLIAPDHLTISRIAHIDSTMTFLVTLALWCLYKCFITKQLRWKLLAGALWGLAIAVKPTALGLILAIIGIKAALYILAKMRNLNPIESVVNWSDIWAVLMGHLTFALVFTGLWHHKTEIFKKQPTKSPIARELYQAGMALQANWILSAILLVLFFGALIWAFKKSQISKLFLHLANLLGVILTVLIVMLFNPAIPEQLARFWTWTLSLSGMKHEGFTDSNLPHPLGYFGLFLNFYPFILIFGVVSAAFFLLRERSRNKISNLEIFAVISILGVILWAVPLQLSPKQAWRYLWPTMPFIFALSAYGITRALESAQYKVKGSIGFGCSIILATLTWQMLAIAPRFETARSSLALPILHMTTRGFMRPLFGMNEGVDFLMAESEKRGKELKVIVEGDAPALSAIVRRRYNKEGKRIQIGKYPLWVAEYLISNFALEPSWQNYNINPKEALIFSSADPIQGTKVYKLPPYNLEKPININVSELPRRLGAPEKFTLTNNETVVALALYPDKHKGGLVTLTPYKFRLTGGPINISAQFFSITSAITSTNAMTVSLGDTCKFSFGKTNEPLKIESASTKCELSPGEAPQLNVRWSASAPIALRDIIIERPMAEPKLTNPSSTAVVPSQ